MSSTTAPSGIARSRPATRYTSSGSSPEILVQFFDARSFRFPEYRPLRIRWKLWVLRLLLGKGSWHCLLDYQGVLWTCSPGCGCQSLWAYPGTPIATFTVEPRQVDLSPWIDKRGFDYWRSVLDVLGFLPEKVRVMNCVQATAVALGINERLRTPRDLYNHLQAWSESWLTWVSERPS